jgi:hypothetical protein
MRAYEFIRENAELPPEEGDPLQFAYTIPGLNNGTPYRNYRFGVAMARARSEMGDDDVVDTDEFPDWNQETAFDDNALVVGFTHGVDDMIDAAMKMTKIKGGKHLVSTGGEESVEPDLVNTRSPLPNSPEDPRKLKAKPNANKTFADYGNEELTDIDETENQKERTPNKMDNYTQQYQK